MGEPIRLRVASSEEAIRLSALGGNMTIDAFSPRVSFEKVEGGTRMDVTDIEGTKSTIIYDGNAGEMDDVPTAGSPNAVSSGGVKTAIDNAVAGKQDKLTFDEVPTPNSQNPVKSGGVKIIVDAVVNGIPRKVSDLVDDSGHYTKPPQGIPASDLAYGVIPDISGKQDLLSFDQTPTLNSTNPVTSNGVKRAIDTVYNQVSGETDLKLLPKANRADDFTEGNLAAIDEYGNYVDSGSKASDFVTGQALASALNGKQDVLTSADKYKIVEFALPPVEFPSVSVLTAGRIVNYTTGIVNVRASCDASEYVDVSGFPMIRYSRVKLTNDNQSPGIAFYDAEQTFIDGSGVPALMEQSTLGYVLHDVAVPQGTKYARFTMLADTETYGNFELYGIPGTFEKLEQKQDKLTFDSAPTSGSTNPVTSGGVYTALSAKADPITVETVSGTDPVITGAADHRYMCGTVNTLTFTPPVSGIVDVVFTSGTTPTVLSVPNTVKWPGWFDPSSLDASTTYEINIMDGVYGVVTAWT